MPRSRLGFARSSVVVLLLGLAVGSADAQLGGGAGAPGARGNPIQLLTEGSRHYRSGDYDKATNSFEQLAAIDPRNATAHYYLALCYARTGEPEKSVARLTEAVVHGLPSPEKLGEDRELAPLMEKQPALRAGVSAIVAQERARRDGVLRPFEIEISGPTRSGVELSLAQLRGAPVAVIFLKERHDPSTEAGLVLQGFMQDFPALKIVGIVDCAGKSDFHRKRALDAYANLTGFTFPLMLSTDELRRKLRPFRAHPTIVGVDREGKATRIVEGLKPDYRGPLAKAIRAIVAVTEQKPGKKPAITPERKPDGSVPKPLAD